MVNLTIFRLSLISHGILFSLAEPARMKMFHLDRKANWLSTGQNHSQFLRSRIEMASKRSPDLIVRAHAGGLCCLLFLADVPHFHE